MGLVVLLLTLEPLRVFLYAYSFLWECWHGIMSVCTRTPDLHLVAAYWPLGLGLASGAVGGRSRRASNRATPALVGFGIVTLGFELSTFATFALPRINGTGEIGVGVQLVAVTVDVLGAVVAGLWLGAHRAELRIALAISAVLVLQIIPSLLYAGGWQNAWRGLPLDAWSAPVAALALVVLAAVGHLFSGGRTHDQMI